MRYAPIVASPQVALQISCYYTEVVTNCYL